MALRADIYGHGGEPRSEMAREASHEAISIIASDAGPRGRLRSNAPGPPRGHRPHIVAACEVPGRRRHGPGARRQGEVHRRLRGRRQRERAVRL